MLALTGTFFFAIGFHSVDGAWNMKYAEHITNSQWVDKNFNGQAFTADEMYIQGWQMIFSGFFITSASLIMIHYKPKKKHEYSVEQDI